jgi:hypothetical protein
MLQEAYLEGFKDGVRWMIANKQQGADEASNSSLK